jgi:hypothetical protein
LLLLTTTDEFITAYDPKSDTDFATVTVLTNGAPSSTQALLSTLFVVGMIAANVAGQNLLTCALVATVLLINTKCLKSADVYAALNLPVLVRSRLSRPPRGAASPFERCPLHPSHSSHSLLETLLLRVGEGGKKRSGRVSGNFHHHWLCGSFVPSAPFRWVGVSVPQNNANACSFPNCGRLNDALHPPCPCCFVGCDCGSVWD